jgi:hypothetical protein
MNTLKATSLIAVGPLLIFMIGAASAQVIAQEDSEFMVELSGQNMVPPTDSQASGLAEFRIMGTDSIEFTLNASDIQGVTSAHLHEGVVGENRPGLIELFFYSSPMDQVSESGTITSGDFQSGTTTAEQQLNDFITVMRAGGTFVTVSTEQNPDGEIRGQVARSSGDNNTLN